MAPAGACESGGDEYGMTLRGSTGHVKRKVEGFVDLTEEDGLSDGGGGKRLRRSAGAKEDEFEEAVDEEESFGGLDEDHDLHGREIWEEETPIKGQSDRRNPGPVLQHLPLFECGTCRQAFANATQLANHNIKQHKQQQRPIRCRKCRQTFTSIAERNHHFQSSPRHFCCRYCLHVVAFDNADSLRYHCIDRHRELYCHLCHRPFSTSEQRLHHMWIGHESCTDCQRTFDQLELCEHRCRDCYLKQFGEKAAEATRERSRLPDHYKRLGISKDSSHEEVLRAAKEMRVKMHPDRRKRKEGLTVEEEGAIDLEAKLVGQAADVLSDPNARLKYDCQVHRW